MIGLGPWPRSVPGDPAVGRESQRPRASRGVLGVPEGRFPALLVRPGAEVALESLKTALLHRLLDRELCAMPQNTSQERTGHSARSGPLEGQELGVGGVVGSQGAEEVGEMAHVGEVIEEDGAVVVWSEVLSKGNG